MVSQIRCIAFARSAGIEIDFQTAGQRRGLTVADFFDQPQASATLLAAGIAPMGLPIAAVSLECDHDHNITLTFNMTILSTFVRVKHFLLLVNILCPLYLKLD